MNTLIIEDYCNFIKCLTTLSNEWEEDHDGSKPFLYSNNENYKKARQFRIHDLYQKLNFSYLCTQLFNSIKKEYEPAYTVYPSNQAGLFKEKSDFKSENNYICVNYTYLHGEPLLEINVHPAFIIGKNKVELYYAIQVQGNAYEHGIQVKKWKAKDVCDELDNGQMEIIKGWMNIGNSEWEMNSDFAVKPNREKPYNKYDMNEGTYVYQKYLIQNKVTIEKVLNQMLCDLEKIIDSVNDTKP